MTSRFRPLLAGWNRIFRCKWNAKVAWRVACGPGLGFAVFTWLGADRKLPGTAEDELTDTIKHCVLFIERGEHARAEQLLHVALRQAQQVQHEQAVTYIYDVLANLALERGRLDTARRLFVSVTQRVLAAGVPEDDSRVVHLSAKLARISHLQKNYDTARLGYEWCLDKLRREELSPGIRQLIALTEDWYGRLLIDCKQFDRGVKLVISALEHMRELNIEPEHIAIQLNDIGTFYDQMGDVDASIRYFTEAVEKAKRIERMEEAGALYVNLGRAYMKKNLLDLARKHCGFGWRLGTTFKNEDIVKEAESCIREVKDAGG